MLLFKLNSLGEFTQICASSSANKTHNSISHKDSILDLYRLVFWLWGKHRSLKFNYLYWLWVDKKLNQCAVLKYVPQTHIKHTDSLLSTEVSVQQYSYSPGTTGRWTWDQKVLRRRPFFSSASPPVALPKSPKEETNRNTYIKISK